ncbi:MAG: glycosyltransferase [Bacteroidetes bacterium]|nr:MAG: glycosyltransferase [Bacteroidota bacterium]
MLKPLVSIITVVYNGEQFIEGAIQSVINQSYTNIQYIVIDGGSTDNTINIINRYKDHIAVFISERDNGISDAFNKGLKQAKGEIVGILNADDWYELDGLEKVVTNLGDNDVVYGDLRLWKDEKPDAIFKGDHDYLTREMTINHPTVFVRRKCYEKYGGFSMDFRYAMDYDLLLRLRVNGCKFAYVPSVLSNMRWGGVSDKYWYRACRESLFIKNKYMPQRHWLNRMYFAKHIAAIAIGKSLQYLKLGALVKLYRSHLSPIKKLYE